MIWQELTMKRKLGGSQMIKTIKIGTRESQLALVQTQLIIDAIQAKFPNIVFEIYKMKTQGDIILDRRLDLIGGKGLFVKELEQALLSGKIDLAIHSMKDVPMELPEGLIIGGVTQREDPRDVLVTSEGKKLEDLPLKTIIGTSSIRREVLILEKRPDAEIKTLRGNVITRLQKLLNQEYDGIILAAAGLKRLGLENKISEYFNVEEFVPAVGQGILGMEIRKGDPLQEVLSAIHHEDTWLRLQAERAFMIRLNGGCSTPFAAHAVIDADFMRVDGLFVADGSRVPIRGTVEGHKKEAVNLGEKLAELLKERARVL